MISSFEPRQCLRLSLPSSAFMLAILSSGIARATNYSPAPNTAAGKCSFADAAATINANAAKGGCLAPSGTNQILLQTGTYTLKAGVAFQRPVNIIGQGSGAGGTVITGNLTVPTGYLLRASGTGNDIEPAITIEKLALDGAQPNDNTGLYIFDAKVTLNDVRVANFTWGGIYNNQGTLIVNDSTIENNSTPDWGGGIYVSSLPGNNTELTMFRSSVLSNSAEGSAGGIGYYGNGNSNLDHVTISGNTTLGDGGGIYSATQGGGYFDGDFVTLANNQAGGTGGGIKDEGVGGTPFRLNYSVASGNKSNGACPDADGPVVSQQSVYAQAQPLCAKGSTCCFGDSTSDTFQAKSNLGPLMVMGGQFRRRVHPLLKSSAALDKVTLVTATTDQRGFFRPVSPSGVADVSKALGDAGAFEFNPRWEAEKLLFIASSGEAHQVLDNGGYSQGKGTRLNANGVNDFVTYEVPVQETGNHKVTIGVRRATGAATFRLSVATSVNGTYTNIGPTVNLNAASSFAEIDLTPGAAVQNLTVQGPQYFRARVTACPANPCPVHVDYIKLVKQ